MVFLDVLKLIFAVFVRKTGFKAQIAGNSWMAVGRHDIGPARTGPSERAHDGSRMVYYCGKHSGVRRGPHDWYGAYLAQDKKGRQANRCHDHHRIPGDISGRQPGVRRHFWDNGRAVVPGIPVRRYRFSHSTSPVTFHCE